MPRLRSRNPFAATKTGITRFYEQTNRKCSGKNDDHNPIALLSEFTPERLEMRASELVLYSRISQAYRRLKEYVNETSPWGRTHAGVLGSKPSLAKIVQRAVNAKPKARI